MDSKERVAWCHKKMKAAIADYDMATANDYLDMAQQWLAKT
jgi:hypothetical protein